MIPAAVLFGGLLVLASSPSAAQNVQVYGQIRLTVNNVKTGNAGSVMEERDNASRLGFRGQEDLGEGRSAMFGLEMGSNADTGTLTAPAFRNSYVALRGDYGTLALGRLDSANPTGSPLYSQVTAITSFAANDAGATAIGTTILNARNRTSNSIGYQSPTWSGVNLRARYYLRGDPKTPDQENGAKSLDLGLNYTKFDKRKSTAANNALNGGPADIRLSDSWGLAGQVGLSYRIDERWSVTGALATARVKSRLTTTTAGVQRNIDIRFHPVVFTVHLGYTF